MEGLLLMQFTFLLQETVYGTKWNNWRTPYYLPSRMLILLRLFIATTEIDLFGEQRQKVRAGIVLNWFLLKLHIVDSHLNLI